jgi:hypothetical protein
MAIAIEVVLLVSSDSATLELASATAMRK